MRNKITDLITHLETTHFQSKNRHASTVDALLSLNPDDRLHRLDRIHYLLNKIKLSHDRNSLERMMVETIISDINVLCSLSDLSKIKEAAAKETLPLSNVKHENIIECCYSSKAIDPFSSAELSKLRSQARANNAQKGITGFLAYDEVSQEFFQIIEGPEKAVQSLVNKIMNDTRHSEFTLRFQVKVKERSYSNWSMSLVTSSEIKSSIAHVDELDDWLSNELFICSNLPYSKSRDWVTEKLKTSYLNHCA